MQLCRSLLAASKERGAREGVDGESAGEVGARRELSLACVVHNLVAHCSQSSFIFVGHRQCVAIDAESRWEDYRTALHAESLLESLAENLDGASTLPAAFRIVDARLAPSS